jgi:hypothetical protein
MFGGKKHRLGTDDQVRMQNYLNDLYYGSIYVGEQDHEMSVVLDTSSDWLVLEGQDCLSCEENKYDPNTSSFFSYVDEGYSQRQYGSFVNLAVRQVQDQVCMLSFNNCVEPFNWLMIYE